MSRSGNKAQRELERLQEQQMRSQAAAQQQKTLDASKNPFMGSLRQLDKDNDGEANFGTPEAVATAVGASFLLGPVGGVLMGVAQGILGKEMRQNALDAWNSEQETLGEAASIFQDNIHQLRLNAENDEDLDQLSAFQSKADAGIRMMKSGIPELEATGAALYKEAYSDVTAYTLTQETQRIQEETLEAQRRVDLDNEQYNRHEGLLADYDSQSANFETTMKNSEDAKKLIARGNPVDIVAALIAVNKSLDPTSVVRPEEAKALGNVGTLLDQAITQLDEWAGTGQALSVDQRKDLMKLVESIEGTARGFQMKRDIRFQERAVDAGLPAKYVNDFRLVKDLPAFKPGAIQGRDRQSDAVTAPVTDQIEAGANLLERTQNATTDAIEGVMNYFKRPEEDRKKARQFRELPTN